MFTSGSCEDVSLGSFHSEALYHASLAPQEYRWLLTSHGFAVDAFVADDPSCGNHTIWLGTFDANPA
jgi:hypothetical protein